MRLRPGISRDPSQQSLDRLFGKVTHARVLDGGVMKGKAIGAGVLLEVADAGELASLHDHMTIVEDKDTFGHCLCLGDQALELYAGRRLKATIGLHHGRSLRWDGCWRHDALLHDGRGLLAWLAERGVRAPLAAYEESLRRAEKYRQVALNWRQGMPERLRPFWDSGEMQVPDVTAFMPYLEKQGGSLEPPDDDGRNNSLAPLLEALTGEYPDEEERILALFQWFGAGEGKWSGFPSYESMAEILLLTFTTERLIMALTGKPLTPAHLEGAARYFSGYWFNSFRKDDAGQIPLELKQQLLTHCLASKDQYKALRARKFF